MKKESPVKSDRVTGCATILKGGNDMPKARRMNRRTRVLSSLVLVAALGCFTAARAAWSQTLPAANRFSLALNKAAVMDKETGLVWEQSPDTGRRDWLGAQNFCNTKTVGGRQGWRLPTAQELASLVDPTQFSPALPSGHPFSNMQSSHYWSATTDARDTPIAWDMFFNTGGVGVDDRASAIHVWCVRGRQGVNP